MRNNIVNSKFAVRKKNLQVAEQKFVILKKDLVASLFALVVLLAKKE